MKGLIVKTVGITLSAILIVSSFILGIISFFSPITLARFTESIGLTDVAISYYEKQYKNTGDLYDLVNLVFKLDPEKNTTDCELYSLAFFKHSGHSEYLMTTGATKFGSEAKACEYFYGKLCFAEYYNGNITKAVKVGEKHIKKFSSYAKTEDGEVFDNPITTLISIKGRLMTVVQLQTIESKLIDIKENNVLVQKPLSQAKITADIDRVQQLIINGQN